MYDLYYFHKISYKTCNILGIFILKPMNIEKKRALKVISSF